MILRFYSRGGARRCWFGLLTHTHRLWLTQWRGGDAGWGQQQGEAEERLTARAQPWNTATNTHWKTTSATERGFISRRRGYDFCDPLRQRAHLSPPNTEVEKLTSSSLLFKYHPARSDRPPLYSTPSPPLRYRDAHGDSEHKSKSVYRSLLIHLATQPVALDGCRCPISILQFYALVPHLWAVSRFRFARR